VLSTGAAYCWGFNGDGQLGDGSTTNRLSAVAVSGGLTFRQVSAGGLQSCGVTTGNAAYCWGDNSSGGLGNGTFNNSLVPALVSGSLTWSSVSAGYDFACGVTSTGVGYCWGENGRGQLGNGTTNGSATPVQVTGGLTWKTISATRNAGACGVTTGDALYCWGLGFTGNIGNGGFDDVSSPTAVLTPLKFIAVQAGDLHTCGIAADSTAYCWGNNERGELGNGTRTIRTTPVAVITGPFSVPPLAASATWMPTEPARLLRPGLGDGRGSSQGGLPNKQRPGSRR
jgi:alpha-tubulin suppressor-like RCC1 family protein